MTTRRLLRAQDLDQPTKVAQTLNDVLLDLYRRVEALERSRFVEVERTTDTGGTMPAMTFAAPPWKVQVVTLAKLFNLTTSQPEFMNEALMWSVKGGQVSIPAMYMPGLSTRYAMTFEIRG